MSERDLLEFRQFLREAVRVLRMPVRTLERRMGIGSGMLARLLDGRLDIRLRHVVALAELLQVAPGDLLAAGCQEATRNARYRMADWMPVSGPPKGNVLPGTVDDLRSVIRDAVREELDARQAPEAAGPAVPARRKARSAE